MRAKLKSVEEVWVAEERISEAREIGRGTFWPSWGTFVGLSRHRYGGSGSPMPRLYLCKCIQLVRVL
jgi:hypothetical protein